MNKYRSVSNFPPQPYMAYLAKKEQNWENLNGHMVYVIIHHLKPYGLVMMVTTMCKYLIAKATSFTHSERMATVTENSIILGNYV